MNGYVVQDYKGKQIFKSGNLYFVTSNLKPLSKGYGSVAELVKDWEDTDGEQAQQTPQEQVATSTKPKRKRTRRAKKTTERTEPPEVVEQSTTESE